MNLNKGINQDVAPIHQPEGTWRDARNVLFSRRYNSISNEDGNDFLFFFPAQPIGIIPLDNDDFVVFCAGDTYDEIGLVSNSVYTRIIKTTDPNDRFNFNESYPIKGKFRISNRGHRIIAFTDNLNPPRLLNITSLPFAVDVNKIPTGSGSITTLNLFSAGDPPTIEFSLNQTGGFLKSGAYYFSSNYISTDNTETGYFTATGPVKINDDPSSVNYSLYDGIEADTITNKSITLTISGVDNRYKFVSVGVISVIAGETTFKKVGQIEIVPGTTTYSFTYTGNEQTEDLLLEQLTVQSQGIYSTAKAITVINDQLALGNLSSNPPFDYQSYANDIVVKWTHKLVNLASTNDHVDVANLQQGGFRCFENYALYIWFRYKDGSYSPAYHIPGRVVTGTELSTSTLASAQGITAKNYQVTDTCNIDGTMSYWENENETYPSDFPDFAGQNVRHHKFPSVRFIKINATSLGYTTAQQEAIGLTLMPVLGINVSNVIIPSALATQIDGWQIGYARRTISNQTCVGQGHFVYASQFRTNISEFSPKSDIFVGQANARSNINFPSSFVTRELKPAYSKISFHSPDLMINKPQITPSFIRNELKLTAKQSSNDSVDSINSYESSSSTTGAATQFLSIDYVKSPSTNFISSLGPVGDLLRAVTPNNPFYVAANTINGNYFNVQSSEYISLNINNGNTLTIYPDVDNYNLPKGNIESINPNVHREDTYLTNLCQLIKNVYSPFTTQELITSTNVIPIASTTTSTYRGDNYVTNYGFTSTRVLMISIGSNNYELGNVNTVTEGVKTIRHYVCESNINIKLRHEGTSNNSKYYPKNGLILSRTSLSTSYLTSFDQNLPEEILLNSDYNSVNIFNPIFPRNTTIDSLTRFPFRVILSERNSNELADSGWRTFLPNNYYDLVTTKGEITNLEADDDVLLIHVTNSLFRTIGVQKLKTTTEEVTIGTGDIFASPPKEILSSELGYLGNQNRFGCGMTKLGYFFFDVSQGKCFIISKDIKEISSTGLRGFFRDNFSSTVVDNPFISTGVNMMFDEKYNRLIISKKGESPFTLSYSPDIGAFASFHDYVPDYMFNTRNKTFSIEGLGLYEHNKNPKGYFYDVFYPSYIEPIFNSEETIHFSNVNWESELISILGTSEFHSTISKILVYNSYQCSGEITLSYPSNIFNSESTWNFNNLYDIVRDRTLPFMSGNLVITSNLDPNTPWFRQRRFIDKWVAVRLIYNNNSSNTLYLYNVNVNARKSYR